jgi:hypothetical protein
MSQELVRACGTCVHDSQLSWKDPCNQCVEDMNKPHWQPKRAPAARQEPAGAPNAPRKHSHYFKDVSSLQTVDVYRVLQLFAVTDHAIGHAAKKLLLAGQRGAKDQAKDVQEAIDTLTRWQEMRAEEGGQQ